MAVDLYNVQFCCFRKAGLRKEPGHLDVISNTYDTGTWGPGFEFGCSSNTANPAQACRICGKDARNQKTALDTVIYIKFAVCLFTRRVVVRKEVKYITQEALNRWGNQEREVLAGLTDNASGGSSLHYRDRTYEVVRVVDGELVPWRVALVDDSIAEKHGWVDSMQR